MEEKRDFDFGVFIKALLLCVMNSVLYFSTHEKTRQSIEQFMQVLQNAFVDNESIRFGISEDLIVYDGKPYYELSKIAVRLVEIIQKRFSKGLLFHRGITAKEMESFLEIFSARKSKYASYEQIVDAFKKKVITNVVLLQKAPSDLAESQSIIKELEKKKIIPDEKIDHTIYTEVVNLLKDIMASIVSGSKKAFKKLTDVADNLAQNIIYDKEAVVSLSAHKDYDAYTFNHSVNVSIMTMAMAEPRVNTREELLRISQAALLHDIGKTLVSQDILNKPGKLTDQEWEIMKSHAEKGAKLLIEQQDVDHLSVIVSYGHHRRFNGKGYPDTNVDVKYDPVTAIINVVDVYEALTAARPYKMKVLPEKAVSLLLKSAGEDFDPRVVKMFVDTFGFYPPGTAVEFDDKRKAQVIRANASSPLRPIVNVMWDENGNELPEPKIVDLSTSPRYIVKSIS